MLATVTAATFTPFIGQTFQVAADDVVESFTLTDAAPGKYAASRPAGMREPFSLLLQGPAGGQLRYQQAYGVTHPALGTLEILLVPVAATPDGAIVLQAVFN